jgi:hypothetical protein
VVLRALSVVPFLLAAAVAMIALITWVLVAVFGFSPPGPSGPGGEREPIWRWIGEHDGGALLLELLFLVGVALVPLGLIVLLSWAALHGFRERPSPFFWPSVQVVYGVLALGMVLVDRLRPEWLGEIGVAARDWWFVFGVVAFGMVTAGMRIRRQRAEMAG